MSKKSREDLPWRIVSLALAALLWIFVINTQNPTQPQEIKNVPIVIKGLEELEAQGYVLKNKEEIENQNFRVIVKGTRLETDKLYNDSSLMTATLNLNQYMGDLSQDSIISIASYTVDILLEGHSVVVTDKKPGVSTVILEKESSVTKKVNYDLSETVTSKYELLDSPSINPKVVEVKGAKSDIDRIDSVIVHIGEGNVSVDQLVQSLPVIAYDIDGEEIENVTIEPATVDVKLLIGTQKSVPLKVNLTGKVPEGYRMTSTKLLPATATIVGKKEVIEAINEIQLEPIDLSFLTETTTLATNMMLPTGVTTEGDNQAVVTIELAKENTYIYSIPLNLLNIEVTGLSDDLQYNILTNEVQVSVKAVADELLKYNNAQIAKMMSGQLDLTAYKEGSYTLPIRLTAAEPIKVLDTEINIEVEITKKVAEDNDQTSEPTPMPEESPIEEQPSETPEASGTES